MPDTTDTKTSYMAKIMSIVKDNYKEKIIPIVDDMVRTNNKLSINLSKKDKLHLKIEEDKAIEIICVDAVDASYKAYEKLQAQFYS